MQQEVLLEGWGMQLPGAGTMCSGPGSSPSAAAAATMVSARAGQNSRLQGGKSGSVLQRNWRNKWGVRVLSQSQGSSAEQEELSILRRDAVPQKTKRTPRAEQSQ